MGIKNSFGNEVEDVIIRALSHHERRNTLKIINSAENGVVYSGILGETGLSTDRLNYHLKELEGFIEKDDERRYRLTTLGKKALSVIHNIREDIDETYENYVSATRTARSSFVKKNLNRGFYFIAGIFTVGSIVATYLLWSELRAWLIL